MYNITRIILVAGHTPNGNALREGGFDTGASFEGYREELQTIVITNRVAKNISPNIEVLVAPDNLNYQEARIWADQNYKDGDFLFEPHRDSTGGNIFDRKELSTRFGVYYVKGSIESKQSGQSLSNIIKSKTGNPNTWLRLGDFELIRDCKAPALLVECAFMQGDNSDEHINWLADILSDSILEFLGKKNINEQQSIDNMLKNKIHTAVLNSQLIQGEMRELLLNDNSAENSNGGLYAFQELQRQMQYNSDKQKEIDSFNTQILAQKVLIEQNEVITSELKTNIFSLNQVVTNLKEELKKATEKQTVIIDSKNQTLWELIKNIITDIIKRFSSRKFLVAILGAITTLAIQRFPEYKDATNQITAVLITYIAGQSLVDNSINKNNQIK